MFDITPDEINQLNDIDLRELVGRLCEAELVVRGLSPAAVSWGGNQTAADGGLDVRVVLPIGACIDGFVPRTSTGFQVKKPDMPRAEIIAEMRPAGTIRPVIQALADEAGAYVIISSAGSTADSALRNRQNALREALNGVNNANLLHTDFYDRTRLATWVRCHPGLISWVKEKVGRALVGWRPYGSWSGAAEGSDAEYMLDDKLRLNLGKHRDVPAQPLVHAIDELRDELAQAGKVVRLVGLSGVGKTRLAQALFDHRVGTRPLPPSLAVFTNLSDNPDPQPTGLASDLIANRTRAVLIVDNCPPDLHRRLSDLCGAQNSTVSVLTIEYDVRDDQPEGTQVVTLDTSSTELIEKLVRRRFQHLSQVDAHTIAEASGGNARIAIALAETVERSDSISGLSNDELFQRLFRQRHGPNNDLLLAAQACSLVYSFQGDALEGEDAELPRLASLAGQTATEIFRHVGELWRRDLAQRRGVWRAVLPHAIANRLAARALEDTSYELINQQLIGGGTERLARSFSRRLSFLHDHPSAVAIVERWFSPDGLLRDVTAFNDFKRAMFENVAPVLPERALAALERVGIQHANMAIIVWLRHLSLLRSLAYDASLFERSAQILAQVATQAQEKGEAKAASDIFVSLFAIYLSGTHATIEQRLNIIERLIKSNEAAAKALGLAALNNLLKTTQFRSNYRFEFGARSRNYGFQPEHDSEVIRWYAAALMLIERLALTEGVLYIELCDLLAQNFSGLWRTKLVYAELERLFHKFAVDGFWREGWFACRQTMLWDRDQLAPDVLSRLVALEVELRPSNLSERVRAVVLNSRTYGHDLADLDADDTLINVTERLETKALELGAEVARDDSAFVELLPDLLRGGTRVWGFGRGLAGASLHRPDTWAKLVEGLEQIAPKQRDIQVLRGFLAELWQQDRDLAQCFLDAALDQSVLLEYVPALHSVVELDERGVERLKRTLSAGPVQVWMYRYLASGRTTAHLAGNLLKDLLLLIVAQPDGFDVAIEILYMRLFSDRSEQRKHEPQILEAGRELLRRINFSSDSHVGAHMLADVVSASLSDSDTGLVAAEIAVRLRQAVANFEAYSFNNVDLLTALLKVQPAAVLNALFAGNEEDQWAGVGLFELLDGHQGNPADAISCDELITWCEINRGLHYPLAASIVTFARRLETSAVQVWSEQATALLTGAPEPERVLKAFIKRFRPMSWSGSRAALIDANARLLDNVESSAPSLISFAIKAKIDLAQEVARERLSETEQDRTRDERFE